MNKEHEAIEEPTETEEMLSEYDFSQGGRGKLPVSMKTIMGNAYENVYTIADYYDGAHQGYADYRGQPHLYRSLYLDEGYNPDEDRFELTPVSRQVVEWSLAYHRLWQKWNTAYRAGTLTDDPAEDIRILPEDRSEHERLCRLIENDLSQQSATSFLVRGNFALDGKTVQWMEIHKVLAFPS